jgi:pyrroloquinoline quinone (PQQ) biosynthesis protein C
MSFFITLVEMTDASRRELETAPKISSMIHHGLPLAEYKAFLRDLYHVVWHFCPVMAAAAARCGDEFRDLRYELYDRIQEEKGHETWVLEDIEALGGDVASGPELPSPPVQAMVAFNYYGAERTHPCSVLGMLYMLEVVSSVYGGRVSEAIARAIGRDVQAGGFKFLSSHASMDVHHMASLNRLVKTIADPLAQAAIVNSTRVNFHQFGAMFGEGGFVSHLGQAGSSSMPARQRGSAIR